MQYTVSAKLIRLTELTLISTETRGKINNEYAEEFKVEYDIKQGDPLSAALYNVVLDVILQQQDGRGNISTCLNSVLSMLMIC